MADTISLDEFQIYMADLLEAELQRAEHTLDEILTSHAARLRGKLREISPKDTGAYRTGWRIKTAYRHHEKVKIIYNAAKPELTYLLEYGEEGHGGRPHIRRALEAEAETLRQELAERM